MAVYVAMKMIVLLIKNRINSVPLLPTKFGNCPKIIPLITPSKPPAINVMTISISSQMANF